MLLTRRLLQARVNSSRWYLDDFAKGAAAALPPGAVVLDAGAGSSPYRRHFEAIGHRYESADFCQVDKEYATQLTYRCRLESIPVEDSRFDLIFCSQTLEHVPEPRAVLREFHRVLKPGGQLWLSAPLFFEEHEVPYDFYRYTRYGFQHLLETAGFLVHRLEWLEGYFGTLSHQLRTAAAVLPVDPERYGGGVFGLAAAASAIALKPFFAAISLMYDRLDLRSKYCGAGLCKNYAIVAAKALPLAETSDVSPEFGPNRITI